ncbi:MAG TPA: glucose 1-dehydrogenase [Nevskiaceae bacterium]|nr:glucose 1-dehydrogenase [Nevskiaceae bacterium]
MKGPTPRRLRGKVAVVTGGTSGIGRASVARLAAEGATVVFCGRRADLGRRVAKTLGKRVQFVAADVEREEDVRRVLETARERHGRLDILFNNAGAPTMAAEIASVTSDEFDRVVRVLFRSVFYGIRLAAPIMVAQGGGSIVSNASVAAHLGGFSTSHLYAACKAAVVQLSRSVALELAPAGVRVNTVSPGAIATGMFGRGAGLEPDAADAAAARLHRVFEKAQSLPRAGLPDDVAAAVAFLASDDAAFVTGRDLVIDGGLIAGRRFSEVLASRDGMRRVLGGGKS